jgi:thiosulfate/3-mercaptopyruvate sulfurtransferase
MGLLLLAACVEVKTEEHTGYVNHAVLMELEEVDAREELIFVDLRKPEQYAAGHLPKAVNINRSEFQRVDLPYGGMALSADEMSALLGSKGIKPDDFLVLYDDKGGVEASRLWWILRMYGHEKVRILNGGLHVWKGDVEKFSESREPVVYDFRGAPMENTLVTYEAFETWRSHPGVKVLDCRSAAEFNGEYIKDGAFLAGHVNGATNICYSHTIDSPENRMKIKSPELLRKVYAPHFNRKDTILVYCQSGVRSAHTLMVLKEILGYEHVYNYDGSWIEWSYFNDPKNRNISL